MCVCGCVCVCVCVWVCVWGGCIWSAQTHNMCGKGWRCTHKAVHTQGGAHIRRSVATAGVLLFKRGAGVGPCVKRSEPRCTMCGARVGGVHTRRCIHKAVHTQGGAHTRWSVATVEVLLFKGGAGAGPRVEQSELSVERSKPNFFFAGTRGGGGVRGCTGGGVGGWKVCGGVGCVGCVWGVCGGRLRALSPQHQIGAPGRLGPLVGDGISCTKIPHHWKHLLLSNGGHCVQHP